MKTFFVLLFLALLGTFIFLKVEAGGSLTSSFNQSTRYNVGKYPFMRSALGLHTVGDARAEYWGNSGPIVIEWYLPQSEDLDQTVLNDFADKVAKYTGRPTQVVHGGGVDDGTLPLDNLTAYQLKTSVQKSAGDTLAVFFTHDYSPRPDGEFFTAFNESALVVSLNTYRNFLLGYSQNMNQYLLAGLLHEFGRQIGLPESSEANCIMNSQVGTNGKPREYFGQNEPQDYCEAEIGQINKLKTQFGP